MYGICSHCLFIPRQAERRGASGAEARGRTAKFEACSGGPPQSGVEWVAELGASPHGCCQLVASVPESNPLANVAARQFFSCSDAYCQAEARERAFYAKCRHAAGAAHDISSAGARYCSISLSWEVRLQQRKPAAAKLVHSAAAAFHISPAIFHGVIPMRLPCGDEAQARTQRGARSDSGGRSILQFHHPLG